MTNTPEIYVSVDVETAGPIPGEYSLLSVGACQVDAPERTFECELKPVSTRVDPSAMQVTGLSLEELERSGLTPLDAMTKFAEWLNGLRVRDEALVFVGLNACFDWSFVNYYFHKYLGHNPFGFSALDIKAYYMGTTDCQWAETSSSQMAAVLQPRLTGDHLALHDAQYQAELFNLARRESARRSLLG